MQVNNYAVYRADRRVIHTSMGFDPPEPPEDGGYVQYDVLPPSTSGEWIVTTDDPPVVAAFVPGLAENKIATIKAATAVYASKINAGYTHTDGHVFQLGPDALGSTGVFNLSAIALLCQRSLAGDTSAWPSDSFIRDAANNNVVYDAATALAVCSGAGDYVLTLRKRYWEIKAAIQAATDQTALDAIDVTSGYP
jgi:hypothetical protein